MDTWVHQMVGAAARRRVIAWALALAGVVLLAAGQYSGVETTRSVSASYFVLVVGDHLLVAKSASGLRQTAEGELTPMPASLQRELFDAPGGYIGLGAALIFVALFVLFARPAWRYMQDPVTSA